MGKNNKGYATVEATLILPLFIFGMLVIYHIIQCKIVENIIYDASVETAEYMAELSYLNETGVYIPDMYFYQYIDDKDMVDKYVTGINFLGSEFSDNEDYFTFKVNYTIFVNTPFMPKLERDKTIYVTQRYYIGDKSREEKNDESTEQYVYVTDNREAYHSTRFCTHLDLSTSVAFLEEAINMGYYPCEYCGDEKSEIVLITDYGDKYHTRGNCSGLKRTIYRVKLSEIGGVPGCLRCVD